MVFEFSILLMFFQEEKVDLKDDQGSSSSSEVAQLEDVCSPQGGIYNTFHE